MIFACSCFILLIFLSRFLFWTVPVCLFQLMLLDRLCFSLTIHNAFFVRLTIYHLALLIHSAVRFCTVIFLVNTTLACILGSSFSSCVSSFSWLYAFSRCFLFPFFVMLARFPLLLVSRSCFSADRPRYIIRVKTHHLLLHTLWNFLTTSHSFFSSCAFVFSSWHPGSSMLALVFFPN